MTQSHTPGPWVAESLDQEAPSDDRWLIKDSRDETVAVVYAAPSGNDEEDANARLIAAAPELLASLKDCLLDVEALAVGANPDRWTHLFQRIAKARASIAKAEGRS